MRHLLSCPARRWRQKCEVLLIARLGRLAPNACLARSPRLCGGALPDAGKLVLAAVCPGAPVEASRVGRSPTRPSGRVHDSLQERARIALYAAADLPWQSGKNRLLLFESSRPPHRCPM